MTGLLRLILLSKAAEPDDALKNLIAEGGTKRTILLITPNIDIETRHRKIQSRWKGNRSYGQSSVGLDTAAIVN